jgi:hypothetical protein
MSMGKQRTHLEIPQTIDQEDIPLPLAPLPHLRHLVTHLHRGIHRFLQELGKVRFALRLVDEGRVVDCDDLAEDLARVAEGERWGESGVWGLGEWVKVRSARYREFENQSPRWSDVVGDASLTWRNRRSERPCASRVSKNAA